MTDAALPTRMLAEGAWPELSRRSLPPPVRLESPAEQVMTPLAELAAATILPDEGLERAVERMAQQDAQVLLVVAHLPRVLGVLALEDLHGEKPLRLLSQRRLARRDLRVEDLMQPVAELETIDLRALRHASVAQVVATLVRSGRPHVLVVEPVHQPGAVLHVRGLLSRIQVERQLGTRLPAMGIAGTFAEIEQALN